MAQPLPLSVATPVAAPEFPHALGVQLSVLAQAGVQHAELQLNPAEMGPVSVHIVMDGSAARIEFGADVAATRQAIESGLPELASALREAGLTLSGGGVSQHARGRGDNGHAPHGAPQRDGRGSASTEPTPVATRRRVSDGGVDLYA
jgi:flagellar hook-length control protein FliK